MAFNTFRERLTQLLGRVRIEGGVLAAGKAAMTVNANGASSSTALLADLQSGGVSSCTISKSAVSFFKDATLSGSPRGQLSITTGVNPWVDPMIESVNGSLQLYLKAPQFIYCLSSLTQFAATDNFAGYYVQVSGSNKATLTLADYSGNPAAIVGGKRDGTDDPVGSFLLRATAAKSTATLYLAGTPIVIRGGAGASASSGAAHGGDVIIGGGTAYGTGLPGKVQLHNGTQAQHLSVAYSYTDSSNYQRAALSTTATAVILSAESAGTGAANIDVEITPKGTGVVKIGPLPTSNPGPGILWNDGGTVKVGT